MKPLHKGILISIEGIDGSGKSTLAKSLHQTLINRQLPALLTREPGATALGSQLRSIVQEKKVPLCSKAEYLLFAADRAQHFDEYIIPRLEEKKIIISDRMADSSLVYQGYGRMLDLKTIELINSWTMNGIRPDLTIYVRVDAPTAMARILKRNEQLSSFEKEHTSFMEKLVAGFDTIFASRPQVRIIDGSQPAELVLLQAMDHITTWLNK